MVIPSIANGFRAAVRALRTVDGRECEFPQFQAPRDRCLGLLMKNLGRVVPVRVVREELESLDIHVQGVT